ncbi:MAG: transaldolase [Candidatus Omnitrophota bacterium]
MNSLKELYRLGQSPWYDNIERNLLKSGEFSRLIADYGIRGVTTNPTIFEKAISKSDGYDSQIKELAQQGKNINDIYDELTITDVSLAADLLRPTFEDSAGWDGYVSIEVFPEYAHEPQATIDYARRVFRRLNRPNIMIKVPGTAEAPAAIKTLISEGVNVNVTLLFSAEHYRRSAQAYIDGLKERALRSLELAKVSSVASVFVSRIDTQVDKLLEERKDLRYDLGRLRGCMAIANSKMIYQVFRRLFSDENFGGLKVKGAKIQRLLWASTSTKNPEYSDVKYVEGLIGKDTVNTLPHETVMAFCDHGCPRYALEENLEEEKRRLSECAFLGIDLNRVCQEIQDAGVKAFQESFEKIILAIKNKVAD